MAYLIANPVEAGAVRYAKDWPGAHTLPGHVGTRVIKVKRPTHYFSPDNPEWPEELDLRLEMPVALEQLVRVAKERFGGQRVRLLGSADTQDRLAEMATERGLETAEERQR